MIADHQKPVDSPFGRHSEPHEVLAGIDLKGKTVIVTGGYSGIGLETVRALAAAGASVTVPARDTEKANAALAGMPGDIRIALMDLADIASVKRFALGFASDNTALDLLINNAGVMACPEMRVGPGWELQFGTNHMGHFALATTLLPLLQRTERPRVVALSSTGHKLSAIRWDDPNWTDGSYDKWKAYGQSKTANSLFALGINARLKDSGGQAFAVHPGGIFTPLQRHLPTEEMIVLGWLNEQGEISDGARAMFKTPTQGCTTTLWAATSPLLEGMGGVYCEDCNIAALSGEQPVRYRDVEPHAVDQDSAERLWEMSETLLAQA
ncbi:MULTISPECIES: oxidoreductase [Pseudomonadota]|jgi:NAD(P)-dependent dehydrogenase (short-subunit alcohol dehydrogenase family)|uniref:oxidoreductase n=1 Tax=Pseudomonadota TaxID=1224 RepID=UPI00076ADEDE|nr:MULTISPECIES: oxidoreductase [Pseudomonadota]MAF63983.1 oxidoreductase [Blastomonas sp.]|tara:strand:+ start:4324 stop:5295 length:972 start_codon:yes stop_codon:yes gene_type:complete